MAGKSELYAKKEVKFLGHVVSKEGVSVDPANVVGDALSRKTQGLMASVWVCRWKILSSVSDFDLDVAEVGERLALCNLVARPALLRRVIDA